MFPKVCKSVPSVSLLASADVLLLSEQKGRGGDGACVHPLPSFLPAHQQDPT